VTSEGSITRWIGKVKTGDEAAAQKLWERYFERLVRLGRKKLGSFPRRVGDEEDVALSAMDSFFQGARRGQFPKLDDRDNLWRLLVVITARKAVDHIAHENRQKRGGGKVVTESAIDLAAGSDRRGIEAIIGQEPSPEFVFMVIEQIESLVDELSDETARKVATMKLEGYTNEEIAERVGCSIRTVERKLWLIRSKWNEEGVENG